MKFHSFVMLADMRTGSNFLEANLNALDGVTCHGEVFNPHFIGALNKTELFGLDRTHRDTDPAAMLARLREKTPGLSGFRYFHGHDLRVFDLVLNDPACAKIVLNRNPLETYVSLKIARDTNQWKLTNSKRHVTARPRFDGAEFEAHLTAAQEFQSVILNRLQLTGQTAFYIDYDDIQDVDILNGLAQWLGVAGRLKAPDYTLKKQNPEALGDKVSNPRDMEQALARLDRFNLSKTPNFEPRRSAAVPNYAASVVAPILFQPVKAAPEAALRRWLGGFGEVMSNFDRKQLKDWKAAHPGFRSFTVLRHPLARAHAAFAEVLEKDAHPELRPHLDRNHGLQLPPKGDRFASEAEFRAAFLIFLGFLKRNLTGQTGLRIAPAFASQSATLQGFWQVQGPDLVLREDSMAEGLAFLSAQLNLPCPALPRETDKAQFPLAALHGPDLESAARAAYDRDYTAFGFTAWKV